MSLETIAPASADEFISEAWTDDLLQREDYSKFLTRFLERKCGPKQPAIVAALDAPWGMGKTYFVERWSEDLRDQKRPVLFFNAWENDSAEDPAVSFMAELNAGLVPIYATLPKSEITTGALEEKRKQLVHTFRRAALPIAAVVGKAIVKKLSGVAIDELTGLVSPDDSNDLNHNDGVESKSISRELFEKGLDTLFEKTLEAHKHRLESVNLFRQQLEDLLDKLNENGATQGPFWVFIDELDRCRPDYAIRLLEGIKHLFSVRGVIFVVSTNLSQLSKAVGAVYGSDFDGYQYLKRFFHLEYTLPEPTRISFLYSLAAGTVLENVPGCSGLDPDWSNEQNKSPILAMSVVAEAMQLDLRSIRSIVSVTEAVVLGMPVGAPVATMWLFFLAAVRHVNPELFGQLVVTAGSFSLMPQDVEKMLKGPGSIPVRSRVSGKQKHVALRDVLLYFFDISTKTVIEVDAQCQRQIDQPQTQYPQNLVGQLARFPSADSEGLHPIHAYPRLLGVAGHVTV